MPLLYEEWRKDLDEVLQHNIEKLTGRQPNEWTTADYREAVIGASGITYSIRSAYEHLCRLEDEGKVIKRKGARGRLYWRLAHETDNNK